jgi:hypothetical protein
VFEFHEVPAPHPAFTEAANILNSIIEQVEQGGEVDLFGKLMSAVLGDDGGHCGTGMLFTALQYRSDPIMGIAAAFLAGVLFERDKGES